MAKSTPSNTGGLSSKSGSAWPGTNSTRSMRISIVDGATRTRTPWRWQRSTSSTASSCGKSASAISTSSMASKWRSSCSSERKSSRPLESVAGPRETKPYGSIILLSRSASDTASMFGPDPTSTARRRYPAARSTTPLTRSNTQRAADT